MPFKEFDIAKQNPANRDSTKQAAIDDAENILLAAGVDWPISRRTSKFNPESLIKPEAKKIFVETQKLWQGEPHTPELVTAINRKIYEFIKGSISIPFTMPTDFPADMQSIAEHEEKGEIAIYQPIELATSGGRAFLLEGFSAMRNLPKPHPYNVRNVDSALRKPNNKSIHSGWRWISANAETPNLGIPVNNAEGFVKKLGYQGLDVNEYITLGLFMKATIDKFPEEEGITEIMLLNSTEKDLVCNGGRYNKDGLPVIFGFGKNTMENQRFGIRMSKPLK